MLTLALTAALAAQQFVRPEDKMILELIKHLPGTACSVGVQQKGKELFTTHLGMADREGSVMARDWTVYRIGELSMPLIAGIVLNQVQSGKVGLDDPIRNYVPEATALWGSATVRQLLSNTAGIPDYVNTMAMFANRSKYPTPQQILRAAQETPMRFAPGRGYEVSHTNYALLGMLLENLAKSNLDEIIRSFYRTYFAMTDTRYAGGTIIDGTYRNNLRSARLAAGLNARLGKTRPPMHIGWGFAGAGLESSVTDMLRFDSLLSQKRMLTAASKALMWSPTELADGTKAPYGMGWSLSESKDRKLAFVEGKIEGYSSYMIKDITQDGFVVVLTNCEASPAAEIAWKMYNHFFPEKTKS